MDNGLHSTVFRYYIICKLGLDKLASYTGSSSSQTIWDKYEFKYIFDQSESTTVFFTAVNYKFFSLFFLETHFSGDMNRDGVIIISSHNQLLSLAVCCVISNHLFSCYLFL